MVWIRQLPKIALALSSLLMASCAMLRIQTVHSRRAVWLSKAGDDASLGHLALLNKGEPTNTDSLVRIENGVPVYTTEFSAKHCNGRDVYVKVTVQDGPNKGIEGWICGASTTHRKVGAL